MSDDKIRLSVEGDVTIITLNDPATLNAASYPMARQLGQALQDCSSGPNAARAVVITGEGRGFCSGANLAAGQGSLDENGERDLGGMLENLYNPLVTIMRDLPIPVVTAVNGAAAGIGCSFALLGDLIVAAQSAYFLQAFRGIGLVPDGGATYLLPRLVGKARAMEMVLLGERISAAQALDWGMINRCVPDDQLMPTALALAGKLARGPAAQSLIRRAIWAGLDAEWSQQLQHERVAQRKAGRTEDFREGVTAFLEKRPAAFKGA